MKTVRQYCSSLKAWLSTARAAVLSGHADTLQFVDIDLDAIPETPRDASPELSLADPWRTQPAVRRKPSS